MRSAEICLLTVSENGEEETQTVNVGHKRGCQGQGGGCAKWVKRQQVQASNGVNESWEWKALLQLQCHSDVTGQVVSSP